MGRNIFKLLGNKIKWLTLPVVGGLLILLFVSLYSNVSDAFIEDYTVKSLGFSKQIAKSFSLELQRVESSIQNFVNKEMKNENNFTTYKTIFNQKLNEIKGSSNNIVGAFVLRKGEVLYTTDSYYKDIATENLMTEIKDEPLWQVAGLSNENYVSHKKNIFVY
ncbi:MAG: hypothetical protein RR957_05670, partial [Oscillospiraceae bacterium]